MRRWKAKTMMMTGMVTTTDAAMIAVIGDWNCEAPVKNESAAGTMRARSVEVSEIASSEPQDARPRPRPRNVRAPGVGHDHVAHDQRAARRQQRPDAIGEVGLAFPAEVMQARA